MLRVVVHYHELALKGKNRPQFIAQLITNLRTATEGLGRCAVRHQNGRLVLNLPDGTPWEEVKTRLGYVVGVANFSRIATAPLALEALKAAVIQALDGQVFRSFRIATKRAFKGFPLTSVELNRELGREVQTRSGASVDLERPDLTVFVEVLPTEAFVFFEKVPGLGGLPVGSSGLVACLISGGIDSPVAAYRMMRRGCRVIFIHFHSQPYLNRASQEKAVDLVRLLTRHQYRSFLSVVPFGEVQRQVVLNAPAPLRVVLYRRLMVRIAEALARRANAKALVTGESLGQVASQTLDNLATIEQAATLPILRPLIGMNKEEISAEAERIGTYEISIIPDQDCCQLFIPTRVATWTTVEEIQKAEQALDVPGLVKQAVEKVEVQAFSWP